MLIKALGILDIFIAVCFWVFGILNFLPERFILILGFILLVKGVIFVLGLSITSIIDIICGILIAIASEVTMPKFVVIIISLFLLQKGIFSLLS